MLWTVAFILVILWLLGVFSGTTMGGLVHVLLIVAIIAIVVNLFRGRRST